MPAHCSYRLISIAKIAFHIVSWLWHRMCAYEDSCSNCCTLLSIIIDVLKYRIFKQKRCFYSKFLFVVAISEFVIEIPCHTSVFINYAYAIV